MKQTLFTLLNTYGGVGREDAVRETIAELAREVISLTGSKSKIVHLPLPADDPQQRQPDISLARNMLGGWEPKIQLRDGLLKTIAYFEEVLSRGGIRR